jgi:hypothetical protein
LYHAGDSKGIAKREPTDSADLVRPKPFSTDMAKVENQRSRGLLDPLETVDLHDPLGPLDDRASFIQQCSKKSNSLKKRKGTKSFRDEKPIQSKKP